MQNIRERLASNILEVPFVKKDGTERVMLCTLMKKYLPETKGIKRKLTNNLLCVFDLENNDWRMINLDTVKWTEIREVE